MAATTMTMTVDTKICLHQASEAMETLPRMRWNEDDHRFHYNVPLCAQPGDEGFVIMHEVESSNCILLSPTDKTKVFEMEKVNEMIHEVELAEQVRDAIKRLEHKRSHNKTTKEQYEERKSKKSIEEVVPSKHVHEPKTRVTINKNPKPTHVRTLKQPSRNTK
ncbi:hypothetical protein SPRG_00944 [Saprolegnia parasitica CBS 223.65]|uniref:Uncharacterized protein n=1 Tax=Saprolegnia parasitica (strain CBS 223.65) TaxID=695850 RepID=A0A067D887_SAPPC|nr:hypothetical protein SPRG_00944 [Saprolegnia parasitica CBS 223.65]KDO34886.1 hypothetical protein SPRG_00944 [Saprolegnia parasitica CBS 223.65]|eukprot:XP_012194546.1 hypothetical protein SPRG_00944 [Saprolegnia parasitica CBS 223.65]